MYEKQQKTDGVIKQTMYLVGKIRDDFELRQQNHHRTWAKHSNDLVRVSINYLINITVRLRNSAMVGYRTVAVTGGKTQCGEKMLKRHKESEVLFQSQFSCTKQQKQSTLSCI